MKSIEDRIVPKNTGKSFIVKKGQHIRVSAESIVDFVAFNLGNMKERFDQARTKANQGKVFITTGDVLYSKLNSIMMTILKDTYKGRHDLQYGMCSKGAYDQFWGRRNTEAWKDFFKKMEIQKREDLPDHGCWENLIDGLKEYPIAPEDIPSPFNLFQSMDIDPQGNLIWCLDRDRHPPGQPAYLELRAEMDCLVGVSACPELGKAGKAKEVRVEIFQV
jgi:uncharacterized protein YcgI (DUF1989 family)